MRVLTRAAASVLTALLSLGGVVAVGAVPALAATNAYSGTVEPTDPSGPIDCSGFMTSYDEVRFTVSATGTYSFGRTGSEDVHLEVRDAGGRCTALSHGGSTSLAVGTIYTMRVLPYFSRGPATYDLTASGAGNVFFGGPAPTISQSSGQADPTMAGPIRFDVVFSEPVTGFAADDVTVAGPAGSSVADVTGSGSSYVVSVGGMTTSGIVRISVPGGAATSVESGAASFPSVALDAQVTYAPAPTVTVAAQPTQADPTADLPVAFDVRFSEPVTGFAAGDVVVAGTAGSSTVQLTGSGASYVATVTDAAVGGSIRVSVPAGAAASGLGTPNAASNADEVAFAPTAPTVSVTADAATTQALPATFAVTFSGAVDGFDASDVIVYGSSNPSQASVSVTGAGAAYAVSVADAQRAGSLGIVVPAGAAVRYGLASTGSDAATTTFAPPRPTATVDQSASQSDPTPEPGAAFDVTFSEPVTGLDAADLVVGGTAGAAQVVLTGSGAAYLATVTGAVRPGTITLALGDAAATSRFGEVSLAATSTDAEVSFDPGTPALAIERGPGQDATTTSDELAFTATFSQAVTGFDAADVVLGGPTGGTVAVTGSGADYVIVVSDLERAGALSVSVPAEAATSAYGVPSAAATTVDATVTFEPVRPSVTVDQAATQADAADVDGFAFDVVFSQPVAGLDASDLVVGGTAGATTVELAGDGASYVATVSGATQPGTVTLSLPEGAAIGAFETTSLASTSTDAEVTFAPPAPTVAVEQAASQVDPTDFGVIAFDVTFSHDVTGLEPESFVVGGTAGGASALLEGSGSTYRAYVADMTQPGTVTLALLEGAAVDRYGLASLASTSADAEVDFAPPAPTATVTRAEGQPAVANAQPFELDVSFSVPVTGFDADDVVITGDTGATIVEVVARGAAQSSDAPAARMSDAAAADDLGYDWTVRISGATSYGVVGVGIRADAVVSGYGLSNAAVEPTADGSVVYAPAVVATPPTAAAPVAAPPVVASAAQASLPRTGADSPWALVLCAMLVLATGGLLRRGLRRS